LLSYRDLFQKQLAGAGFDARIWLWSDRGVPLSPLSGHEDASDSEFSLDWQVGIELNCQRAQDYLQHSNDELAKDNRHLCDGILTP
jgi:hypothetical protein